MHTFYQQPGGEDQVFAAEKAMLKQAGCEVLEFTAHNEAMEGMGRLQQAQTTLWNGQTYTELRAFIKQHRPEVMHVHNTFPLMSPSIFHAAKAEGLPIVMTLHNFRLFCANYNFFRDGKPCTDCLKQFFPYPAIQHSCYRDNRGASAVVASMLTLHRLLGSWSGKVDRFIALTEFAKGIMLEGGLPKHKLTVKPNFIQFDPGVGTGGGGFALFVGRLSPEKGLGALLEAWHNLPYPLKIAGDGPMAAEVAAAAQTNPRVEWLGRQPRETVLELMQKAEFLVFPSQWFEGFPMTIVEAYVVGLPIVASNLGSMASLVKHGETGLHFEAGNPSDLAKQARAMFENPLDLQAMRHKARLEYQNHYTAEQNLELLLEIYRDVMK